MAAQSCQVKQRTSISQRLAIQNHRKLALMKRHAPPAVSVALGSSRSFSGSGSGCLPPASGFTVAWASMGVFSGPEKTVLPFRAAS